MWYRYIKPGEKVRCIRSRNYDHFDEESKNQVVEGKIYTVGQNHVNNYRSEWVWLVEMNNNCEAMYLKPAKSKTLREV